MSLELANPSSSEGPSNGTQLVGGHGDDHGHGHAAAPAAPSRIPPWVHDMLEKVFKIRKRNSTVEVKYCRSIFMYFGRIKNQSFRFVLVD